MKIFILIFGMMLLSLTLSCKKDDNLSVVKKEVKDYDGNVYDTVAIGTQVWLVKNLKTTHYNNGNLIGTTTVDIHNETEPRYQWGYNDNEQNVDIYGRLYTWYVVSDPRGICPVGWHVSNDGDWLILETFLGGSLIAGGKLKETGTVHWNSPNTGASNSSGFTGLPGGYRTYTNIYVELGNSAFFWTSTESNLVTAWTYFIRKATPDVQIDNLDKMYGFSVRCIKD
jgi:uncharacterized protein (TIGR02145 family)